MTLLLTVVVLLLAARLVHRVFTALRLDPWALLVYFGLAEYRRPAVSRRGLR